MQNLLTMGKCPAYLCMIMIAFYMDKNKPPQILINDYGHVILL